jgi:hypothetical protein
MKLQTKLPLMKETVFKEEFQLHGELIELFSGENLEAAVGFTVQLLTLDDEGWPRIALLSVGEVLAVDDTTVRLALWPESRTTGNLIRSAQGVLAFVHREVAYTVRIRTVRLPNLNDPLALAVFDGRVTEVRRDQVSYAVLQSGITFNLPDRAQVLTRWNATIEQLRRHTPAGSFAQTDPERDPGLERPVTSSPDNGQ